LSCTANSLRAPSGSEHEGWIGRLLKGAPPGAVREAIGQLREAADEQQISVERQAVERSGLFDAPWYLRMNRDVADAGTDPLDHYIRHGRQDGRGANAYLVDHWYRKRTRIRRGTDALLHYASKGEPAGHPPGPNFNPVWYREVYRLANGASPLAHFLAHRTTERLAPRPALWSAANAAAAPEGGDPFTPYLAGDADIAATAAADIAVLAGSGLIDISHYLVAHSDVTEAVMDPVSHFCAFGWKEGRNPNAYFDTRWYVPPIRR
jgi:hypothetical protein